MQLCDSSNMKTETLFGMNWLSFQCQAVDVSIWKLLMQFGAEVGFGVRQQLIPAMAQESKNIQLLFKKINKKNFK